MGKRRRRKNPEQCSGRKDGIHCVHWHDGDGCCACSAPAMTDAERKAQGMIE